MIFHVVMQCWLKRTGRAETQAPSRDRKVFLVAIDSYARLYSKYDILAHHFPVIGGAAYAQINKLAATRARKIPTKMRKYF